MALLRPRAASESTASAASLTRARAAGVAEWSSPAVLSSCRGSSPRVLFPRDMPDRGTGPGAIVWSDASTCPGGAGARIAPLAASSPIPLAPSAPHGTDGRTLRLRPAPLQAAPGPHGQIVIAGLAQGPRGRGLILQGRATGPFLTLASRAPLSAPFALSDAYLGDVALAVPSANGPLVQVERFFSNVLGVPRVGAAGAAGPIRALTVAMDYRSDTLAAWAQGSSVYAQDLPASGVRHPVQRIGSASSNVQIAALLSDDNRGMVVWQDRTGQQTSVHFDYSASGVVFPAPTLLERFADPDDRDPRPASPRLIRLSSESVMLAWAGASRGRWVIRTAAVDRHGIGARGTIDAGAGDALLDDLVPGSSGEALLLLSEPQPGLGGPPEPARMALLCARGLDVPPDRTSFGPPEPLAPPGPVAEASLGIDPDTDDAIAVWTAGGGAIEYSVRSAS